MLGHYCIQVWNPYMGKDIDILEKVQKRAARMVVECKGMNYEKRLKVLCLTTLETRRKSADLLEVYKILNIMEGLDENKFFTMQIGNTRGHSRKLFKIRSSLDIAKYSFSQRVFSDWNELPEEVVSAKSINVCKNR